MAVYSTPRRWKPRPLNAFEGTRVPGCSTMLLIQHFSLKDPPLDLPKQNVTVIVKIYINGKKELTGSHSYQI